MISALITGSIVSDPRSGISKSGTEWSNCVVRCPCGQNRETGDAESAFVQIAAFGSEAGKLARLARGDAISATGALKPTEYVKNGETRHGLSLTAQAILTAYGIAKKRGDSDGKAANCSRVNDTDREQAKAYANFAKRATGARSAEDFDDAISF